jgi:oligopeptide/dipeptide ABC transporter ATP-binding protein
MESILRVKELECKYQTRDGILTAIRQVGFEVGADEIVGVVGESGCGKSTVASAIMRLLPPNGWISGGQVLFKDRDLCGLDEEEMRRLRGKEISMIFQDPMTSLNPVFSIEEQMLDALRASQGRGAQDRSDHKILRETAIHMLERVGISDAASRIKEYPHQFSGGMRQRIMIATALMANPALLVADEPTSALDVTLEAQIIDLIRELREELGTAILYITHDLGVVAQLCDRVLVMYAGSIVEAGDVYSIFETPQHPYTRALLRSHPSANLRVERLTTIPGRVPSLRDLPRGCKFAPRCDTACPICHVAEPQYLAVGQQLVLCHVLEAEERDVEPHGRLEAGDPLVNHPTFQPSTLPTSHPSPAAEIVVHTRELRTHFRDTVALLGQLLGQQAGAVRAVDGVDIQIRRGETLALVGESGSGKTTLGRTLLRLENSTSGEIIIEGQNITHLSPGKIRPMRARMQMIFQDPYSSLSPRMKVSSILLEPFLIHGVPGDAARPGLLTRGNAAARAAEGKVEELLQMVGLSSEQADKYPHQLSGGQARRVGIARALALRPDLLVADEPTAGLDVSVAAGILNLLKDLRVELGDRKGRPYHLTYLIITHNLNVISFIADRVAVMYLGKIVELADTEALFRQPKHPYTEALMSAIAVPDPRLRHRREQIILKGEIPSSRNPSPGCAFHPRCPYAEAKCATEAPLLSVLPGTQGWVACHFPERVP